MTASDVTQALAANDFISGIGSTKGQMVTVTMNASTGLHSAEEFQNLAVRQVGDTVVRLRDVATVELGSEDYDFYVLNNGKQAIIAAISGAPDANVLDVTKGIRAVFPSIKAHLPEGMEAAIVFDASDFVNASIHEVEMTIFAALLIVMGVVFLFLGSPRAVFIPVVAIPAVADRHLHHDVCAGLFDQSAHAARHGARHRACRRRRDHRGRKRQPPHARRHESVFRGDSGRARTGRADHRHDGGADGGVRAGGVPVGGLTGALFTEFAFTLIGTVTVSAIVALTLSPMLCSRMLHAAWPGPAVGNPADRPHRPHVRQGARAGTNGICTTASTSAPSRSSFAILIALRQHLLSWTMTKSELAPAEDQAFIMAAGQAAPNATVQQNRVWIDQAARLTADNPYRRQRLLHHLHGRILHRLRAEAMGPAQQVRPRKSPHGMSEKMAQVPGISAFVFPPPSLPGSGGGLPVQLVITTSESFDRLNQVVQRFMDESKGLFYFSQSDLKIDRPQATLVIDRDKAAAMGLSMATSAARSRR